MNPFKKTLIFFAIVACGVGYGFYDYHAHQDSIGRSDMDELVFGGWGLNEIEAFEIKEGDKYTKGHRDINGWVITSPLEDRADITQVAYLVDGLLKEKIIGSLGSVSSQDEYGTDTGNREILLVHKNGQRKKVFVGNDVSMGSGSYLRIEDEVVVGSEMWKSYLKPKLSQMRSRHIFPFQTVSLEVVELKIFSEFGEKTLRKVEDSWKAVNGVKEKFGQKEISAFIDNIGNLKASNLVTNEVDQKHRSLFGLDKVQFRVNFKVLIGSKEDFREEQWMLEIGAPHNGYTFAIGSDRKVIYRLGEERVKRIISLSKFEGKTKKPKENKNGK